MTHLPLELISILNLMRINFFIGQAPDVLILEQLSATVDNFKIVFIFNKLSPSLAYLIMLLQVISIPLIKIR